MQSTRVTRSSVLGKRPHQAAHESNSSSSTQPGCTQIENIPTPEPTPNPKRPRTSTSVTDDGSNKENIPPFKGEILNTPAGRTRMLRRTSTGYVTPTRTRNMPRRSASAIDLASTLNSPIAALATPPTSPPSPLPLHARARALLRPICNDVSNIAGRNEERKLIREFITSFLALAPSSAENSALYVSGTPGTGKTALINAVMHSLEAELEPHTATVISVNCMALTSIDAIWDRLAEELSAGSRQVKRGRRKAKETPSQRVEALLADSGRKCVLILDELDHLTSSLQALASLFTLSQSFPSSIRIIGIANTHTLASASSTAFSAQSLAGVKTVHFAPYTPQELLEIVNARLVPMSEDEDAAKLLQKFLPAPTLTLLTKKVASQTGDVRAVFEVLRGAIDLAVASASPDSLDAAPPAVTPAHVLSALKAYAPAKKIARVSSSTALPTPASTPVKQTTGDSEIVTKVRDLGLHSRLVLLALLLACRRISAGLTLSGSPSTTPSPPRTPSKRSGSSPNVMVTASSGRTATVDASQLHTYYSTILTRGENSLFTPVSRSEFGDLTGVLETVGLISLSSGLGSLPGTPTKSGRRGFGRSTSFNMSGSKSSQEVAFVEGIRLDEVARGLGIVDTGAQGSAVDVREEEVCAIWERERARISREARAQSTCVDASLVFEHAAED